MSPIPTPQKCFTTVFNGRVAVLKNEVGIGEPMVLQPGGPPPNIVEFTAIWDTGATNCVISSSVVARLNLQPTGIVMTQTPAGPFRANTYFVNIYLPNRVYVPGIRVTEGNLGPDTDVLIGMEVINKGDFAVTNFQNQTVMSFRIPSSHRIDFVAEVKTAAQKEAARRDPDDQRKERNRRKRFRRG
jgi:hypothetical protein